MRFHRSFVAVLCGSLILLPAYTPAMAESWIRIEDPVEIRQLIVGNTLDGKYWKFYFRSDGVMAFEQDGFISIRGWTINADSEICMNIYSKPDKSLGCETISRADGSSSRYQLKHKLAISEVQIVQPDQALVEAVIKRAGAVK